MKLLEGIIEAESCQIENPMIGMDYLEVRWSGAVFLRDFGPWRAGDKAYSLIFDPQHGTLTQGDNWGNLVKDCKVKIVPV